MPKTTPKYKKYPKNTNREQRNTKKTKIPPKIIIKCQKNTNKKIPPKYNNTKEYQQDAR